ncbi:MAG: hypothetical protein ABL921_26800 [Pirellula sp.]
MVDREESWRIESVRFFHQHLEDLSSAGIKLDLGFSSVQRKTWSIPALQRRFEQWVEQHPDSTQTEIIQSYLATATLPSAYLRALELWVQGERVAGLEILSIPVSGQRLKQRSYSLVALQVVFFLSAVFVTLVMVCSFLVPIFSGLQEQSFHPVGPGLQSLQWMRAWLPVWGVLVPILFALLLFFRRSLLHYALVRSQPSSDASFALAELRGSLSSPVRLPIVANLAILLCGVGVVVVVYGIYGTTIELLLNILSAGASRI